MTTNPQPIVTSRSAYIATDSCWRLRWLACEAPNGTITNGWQRRAAILPLAAGIYVHGGIAKILSGVSPYNAACHASDAYRTEMTERGLDTAEDMTTVIEEQSMLIAGLVYGWGEVRWPQVASEWDVVSVEQEGQAQIAEDVILQFRADAIMRRKRDSALFIWNFKTLSLLNERWFEGWEIDPQVLTEAWAAERSLGEPVEGVIIEGLIKGARRKDWDEFGNVIGERQRSLLCYGYYHPGNPPLTPPEWTHEYKLAGRWQRFAVGSPGHPSFDEWFSCLPQEIREAFFVSVPPVCRDDARVFSKLRQIAARERRIHAEAEATRTMIALGADEAEVAAALDESFPQSEHHCLWPSRCAMFDVCHVSNVGIDMAGSGLYVPRVPHHPVLVEAE